MRISIIFILFVLFYQSTSLAKSKTFICISNKSIGFSYEDKKWNNVFFDNNAKYLITQRYEYFSSDKKGPLNLPADYELKFIGKKSKFYCNSVKNKIYCEFGLSSFFTIDTNNSKYVFSSGSAYLNNDDSDNIIWLEYGICNSLN